MCQQACTARRLSSSHMYRATLHTVSSACPTSTAMMLHLLRPLLPLGRPGLVWVLLSPLMVVSAVASVVQSLGRPPAGAVVPDPGLLLLEVQGVRPAAFSCACSCCTCGGTAQETSG